MSELQDGGTEYFPGELPAFPQFRWDVVVLPAALFEHDQAGFGNAHC
jgi:hypothetical protein